MSDTSTDADKTWSDGEKAQLTDALTKMGVQCRKLGMSVALAAVKRATVICLKQDGNSMP